MLHDLGKYGRLFQERLKNPKKVSRIDHWSAGAWASLAKYKSQGIVAALAVQGHHLGLQKADRGSLEDMQIEKLSRDHPLRLRLSEPDMELLLERQKNDGLTLPETLDESVYD